MPTIRTNQLTSRRQRLFGAAVPDDPARDQLNPRPRKFQALLLRLLDVTLASTMLLQLAPLLLVVGVAVKRSSPGPVLYRQQRIGRHGIPFTIFKFRTMPQDAEARTGPVWAKFSDPRCTRLGSLLRRTCIDELPQLFNVLRGEMSLVGPRPERPFFVDRFVQQYPEYRLRHEVLPGLTGWAQVNGWRGDTSLERRLECDLEYVRRWSVPLYLKVLLLTPWRIVFQRSGS